MKLHRFVVVGCMLGSPCSLLAQTTAPITNPIPVYVHLLPWFQTPETLGGTNWGWHWTMNDRNPNVIDSNGQREIASYYYPLIGPYDSSDPYVIEDQMLLMKVSGISGVIVDWYGVDGSNGDINSLLSASNKIVSATQTYGLQVGVCLEDRFATSTSNVTANINYLDQNYFTQPNYIKVGTNKTPLMLLFGPETYTQPSQWTTILSGVSQKPAIVPLQYQASQVGSPAAGEFGWVYENPGTSNYLNVQEGFLNHEAGNFSQSIGDAYPGYNDYYAAGDDGPGAGFVIPENGGQTLSETLAQDQTYSKNISAIQIATWNDYGEGTQIEPTVQDGFTDLEEIQKFTGVPYGLSQLQLVYQLFEAREALKGNANGEALLSETAADINNLEFPQAYTSLAAGLTSIPSTISTLNALTLSGTAALDLTNQHLFITYSAGADPVATIRDYLAIGYNGGSWNGLGIISSTVATANSSQSSLIYSVGYADGSDGITNVPSGEIEILPTLAGDAKLQGNVVFGDFQLLSQYFGQSNTTWDEGNFTYGSTTNFDDFQLLSQNFGASASALTSGELASLNDFAARFEEELAPNSTGGYSLVSVPEPCSVLLLATGLGLTARLRRRSR